jgi:hypothetical protein
MVGHIISVRVQFKCRPVLFNFAKMIDIGHYIIHSFKTSFNEVFLQRSCIILSGMF